MKIIGIIPERMNSSRFPGKPLASICGKPMVQHVYENSKRCKLLDNLFVATGDREIIDCVNGFGGSVIKTRDDHFRASNQVAEALKNFESSSLEKYDIVCMIQGDEPMVKPEMINSSIRPLINDKHIQVTNLMGKLNYDDIYDSNEIKVVTDKYNNAMYFSRLNIPYSGINYFFKQVCIISFQHDTLLKFPLLKETPLEKYESIDMLRLLEHGIKIKMVLTDYNTFSVDIPKDLKYVEYLMRKQKL